MSASINRYLVQCTLALSSLTCCISLALAQDAPDAASSPKTLDKVQVTGHRDTRTEGTGSWAADSASTATRMDLSPRETPQSVTIITRQRLDDMGVNRLDDVLAQTTGVTVGGLDTERTSFSARGFAVNNFQIDGMLREGTASNHGVAQPNTPLFDTLLYDRIEVVRGATGLMGGTGDPSAAINLVRKRPTKAFQGAAGVSIGRWDYRRGEIDLSAPLNRDGSVRARGVFARQSRDWFIDRYHENKSLGMLIAEADLTAHTLFTAGVDFQDTDPKGVVTSGVPYWTSTGERARIPRNVAFNSRWNDWPNKQHTLFTSVQHIFNNGWKLHLGVDRAKNRNSFRLVSGSGYPDSVTGSGITVSGFGRGKSRSTGENLDLYATGPLSLFGRTHTLIAGFNGNEVKSRIPQNLPSIPGFPLPDYREWDGNFPEFTIPDGGPYNLVNTRSSGGYLSARWSLADPLHVITGARISNYRTATHVYNDAGQYQNTRGVLRVDDEVTPYIGMVWDIDARHSLYASYTDLFRPQNFKDRNDRFLDPETGSNLEAGIKGEYFDGAFNASLAVFEARKTHLAELDTSVPPGFLLPDGSQAYIARGDGVKVRGMEIDLAGNITPQWNVSLGYTLLRARTADGQRAATQQPRHLLRAATSWRFAGILEGLHLGASASMQSDTYNIWVRANKGRIDQPSYTLLNLMARYEINQSLQVQLNVNNLLDKAYYRNVGFYDGVHWGEPRNITATLRAKF